MEEAAAVQYGNTKVALRDYIENQININDPGPPDESGLVPCPVCKTKLSPEAEICGKCRHPIGPIRRAKARFRSQKFWWFWLSVLITVVLIFLLYRMYSLPPIADPLAHLTGKLRAVASYIVAVAIPVVWINYWWRYGRFRV